MVIYKDFTLREIQDSISKKQDRHNRLSSSMTEDAVSWLHEALKLHTSRDGSCRDRQEICERIKKQFEAKYGGKWCVVMGNFNSLVITNGKSISFALDHNEATESFCVN